MHHRIAVHGSTAGKFTLLLATVLTALLLSQPLIAQTKATPDTDSILEAEAEAIGYQAYIWGFIYVKSMLLRDEAVNPNYRAYTPINSIISQDTLAKPGFTDFTPNNDTLYGLGWLDLSQGPILMTVPALNGLGDRYWTMQATDYGLNSLEYVGSRVKSKPGVYAYARKDWQGELPAGVKRIDSPSDTVFLQLRTFVNQDVEGDLAKVVAFNRSFSFEPLNKEAVYPPVSKNVKIRDAKNTNPDLHSLEFFNLLNEAVTRESPLPGEEAVYAQFAAYGIGPGTTFNPDALTQSQHDGLQRGIDAAAARLLLYARQPDVKLGGFSFHSGLGEYGFDFPLRSTAAYMGYGANSAKEAVYSVAFTDDKAQPLTGQNRYRIHFDKGNLPPVDAFWSFTMYQLPGNQLVPNPIDRYNINASTRGLQYNEDGSLTIYIQNEQPAENKISNWLPAPEGSFWLVLRLYNPRKEILEGKYVAPYVENLGPR